MDVHLRQIKGPWDIGWVLDKHMLNSIYLGDDEYGHPRFQNTRTEVGEATYQLKYQFDKTKAAPLADAIVEHIVPELGPIHLVIPMPASTQRRWQPVMAVTEAIAERLDVQVFEDILRKKAGASLKNLHNKAEKIEAMQGRWSLNDQIASDGPYNALIIDDLYHSGATMEAACTLLQGYAKIGKIYVAALTWRQQ